MRRNGVLTGGHADHLGASLDLAVEALDRVGGAQLGPMRRRKGHASGHVSFGVVEEAGELGHLGAELVGDFPPLGASGFGVILGKRGGDEGRDDAPAAVAGMRQRGGHEVQATALPAGVEHLGDRNLGAFVGAGDDELDAAQARRASLRRNAVQNVSASEGPISRPRISRRPSLLAPTATIAATETIRPAWRTLT